MYPIHTSTRIYTHVHEISCGQRLESETRPVLISIAVVARNMKFDIIDTYLL